MNVKKTLYRKIYIKSFVLDLPAYGRERGRGQTDHLKTKWYSESLLDIGVGVGSEVLREGHEVYGCDWRRV